MSIGGWVGCVYLSVVEGMCGAQVGEAFQEVKGYPPFSRIRDAGDAECIGTSHVADYCLVVGECDYVVPCGDNVVYTN